MDRQVVRSITSLAGGDSAFAGWLRLVNSSLEAAGWSPLSGPHMPWARARFVAGALQGLIWRGDAAALYRAQTAQDAAFREYLAAHRESVIHRAVRVYAEAR